MKPLGLAVAAAVAMLPGSAFGQKITSSVYADDEFKIFITKTLNTRGVEFAQGAGWGLNFVNTLVLYHGSTSYQLHVWVRDIGGPPTGLLGEFQLGPERGCRFANNTSTLLTGTNHWRVTKRLPATTPLTGGHFSPNEPYFNNDLPKFVTPTLVPASLGANSSLNNPWPGSKPFPGVNGNAHWITSPAQGPGPDMWFSTRITCQSAS